MNDLVPSPAVESTDGRTAPIALTARSVVYSYGHTPALRGVSMDLHRGEILAVTGPSGSGKSTLMLCLAGILVPDAGDVTYDGRHISQDDESHRSKLRRTEFGVLFQFGQLVPELTAAENVALPSCSPARSEAPPSVRPQTGSSGSAWQTSPCRVHSRCPVVRASASPLLAPWSRSRVCSSPTSRRARSTRSPASR